MKVSSIPCLMIALGTFNATLAAEGNVTDLSASEVATHDSEKSCWLIIHNKIYDVTTYIPRHPEPKRVILDYCGKDATNAFETKNRGRPHSPRAREILSSHLIGTVTTAPP